jgi:hypothetical protein
MKVLMEVFEPTREDVKEAGEGCIMKRFIICAGHQVYRKIKPRMTRPGVGNLRPSRPLSAAF